VVRLRLSAGPDFDKSNCRHLRAAFLLSKLVLPENVRAEGNGSVAGPSENMKSYRPSRPTRGARAMPLQRPGILATRVTAAEGARKRGTRERHLPRTGDGNADVEGMGAVPPRKWLNVNEKEQLAGFMKRRTGTTGREKKDRKIEREATGTGSRAIQRDDRPSPINVDGGDLHSTRKTRNQCIRSCNGPASHKFHIFNSLI